MAVTRGRNTVSARTRYGDTLRIPMAADAVCYIGALVCRDADGYAVNAADAEGYVFAGLCVQDPQDPTAAQNGRYSNLGGDDGEKEVVVRWSGRARLKLALRTPSADMRGARVYVYDNETVAVHKFDVAYDVQVGSIIRVPGDVSTAHKDVQLASDEVEVEFWNGVDDWSGDVTTTQAPTTTVAPAGTTTTAAGRTTTVPPEEPSTSTLAPEEPTTTTPAPPTTTTTQGE